MDLRGLRTFCLVARYLSFKDTATELCLTASAVSHQIGDLESRLGCKLFHRLTRSISLTQKGQELYHRIAPHIDAIDKSVDELKSITRRIPLIVQVPEFFASELLMPIISGFSEENDDIDLRIESLDNAGDVDPKANINILLSSKMPIATKAEKLFPISYMPSCSKEFYEDLGSKGFRGLDGVNDCTLLLHKARPNAWERWAQFAGLKNFRPKRIIYVDSMFALARAAEQSVGIALVPMPVSKAWFDSGALVPLHSTNLITEDYYWVVLNHSSRNPEAAKRFCQWTLARLKHYRTNTVEPGSFVA